MYSLIAMALFQSITAENIMDILAANRRSSRDSSDRDGRDSPDREGRDSSDRDGRDPSDRDGNRNDRSDDSADDSTDFFSTTDFLNDFNDSMDDILSAYDFVPTTMVGDSLEVTVPHDHLNRDNGDQHVRGQDQSTDDGTDDDQDGEGEGAWIQGDILSADIVKQIGVRGGRGRHGHKSRSQNKRQENEADDFQQDLHATHGEPQCMWNGSGCHNDCDEDEMRAFCTKIKSMATCNEQVLHDEEQRKCVWTQEVEGKETVFSIDMLMATRSPTQSGMLEVVVKVGCVLVIAFAVYEMYRGWRYRDTFEYTKIGDALEGDLHHITVV